MKRVILTFSFTTFALFICHAQQQELIENTSYVSELNIGGVA